MKRHNISDVWKTISIDRVEGKTLHNHTGIILKLSWWRSSPTKLSYGAEIKTFFSNYFQKTLKITFTLVT